MITFCGGFCASSGSSGGEKAAPEYNTKQYTMVQSRHKPIGTHEMKHYVFKQRLQILLSC